MSREEKARKVRAQITKIASVEGSWSVNELRIVLGLERIVARLIHHKELEKHLVYKGGFVLMKALGSDRFTRDLDALGVGIDKNEVIKPEFDSIFTHYITFKSRLLTAPRIFS